MPTGAGYDGHAGMGEGAQNEQPSSRPPYGRPRPCRPPGPGPAPGGLRGTRARFAGGPGGRHRAGGGRGPLPDGFQESTVFSGLTNPTVVRFAPDGRVFVAEKRGVIKVFDSLTDTTPTVFADLQRQRLQLLGPGAARHGPGPELPDRARTSTFSTPTTTSSARPPGAALGDPGVYSDPCPTPPGPTGDGCVVSGRLSRLPGQRQRDDRHRAGADRGLVPAVPEPLDRRPGVRAPTGPCTPAAATGPASTSPTAARTAAPLNPCGDPPGGVGATLTPPTAEGGALRSQDLRTTGDPVSLDGTVIRRRPGHRRGAAGQPAGRQRRPQRPADHRLRAAQPVPLHHPPEHQRAVGWATSAGTTGRRSTASPTRPTRRSRTSAGRATRAPAASRATTAPTSASARTCTRQAGRGHRALLRLPPQRPGRPQRDLPDRQLLDRRAAVRVRRRAAPIPAEYDGALFFADYSRDCIWVMPKGADGNPAPGQIRHLRRRRGQPGQPGDGTGRRPLLRRLRRRDDPSHQLHRRQPAARPRWPRPPRPPARRRSRSTSTARAPATPTGDPLTYAWDLDGDGAYDDSTAARPTYTYTSIGELRRHAAGDRQPGGLSDTDTVTITVGNTAADGHHHHPGGRHDLEGRRRHQLLRLGDRPAGGHACRRRRCPGSLVLQHCPSNCHTHPLQTFAGVASGSFTAPDHEYPSYLELRLTATDSGGLTNTVIAPARPPDRGADLPDQPRRPQR